MECPICQNQEEFTPLFPKFCTTNNFLCNKCGLVFIPRSANKFHELYKDEGYLNESADTSFKKQLMSKNFAIKRAQEQVGDIVKLAGIDLGGKKVLDVGCGYGAVLWVLKNRHDCKVLGIEPSRSACEYGLDVFDVEIIPALFEEQDLKQKFDLIICSHVVEHVSDLEFFMKKISSILSENGLVYIEVPNVLWPTGKYKLENFFYEQHLQTFSAYTLFKLFDQYGFKTKSYDDSKFLKFIFTENTADSIEVPKIEAQEIFDFLEKYSNTYGIKEIAWSYYRKLRYLFLLVLYKFKDTYDARKTRI